jgi:hypothetical protein
VVLRVLVGQAAGQPFHQTLHRRTTQVAEPTQLGSHPPERRPVVTVPVLDQQRGSRVGLQIAFALEPRGRFCLDKIDGDTYVAVRHGVDDGHDVGTTDGVERREDTMAMGIEAIERLLGGEVHLMTTKKSGGDRRGQRHTTTAGQLIVRLARSRPLATTSEVGS